MKYAEDRLFAFKCGHSRVLTKSITPALSIKTVKMASIDSVRRIPSSLITYHDEILGEGRFGICKLVSLQGSPVCIKEVRADVPRAKELIMHEASVLLRLCHPSVCFLLGIQILNCPYFLVLNLYAINGFSISIYDFLTISFLADKPELTPTPKQHVVKNYHALLNIEAWLKIMHNIINGLHYIHKNGLLHRDLKTDNVIFYEKSGVTLLPVIVDFGKCESFSNCTKYSLTDTEKEDYRKKHKHIAPDLVDGIAKPSPASDVYGFGRIFKNVICYFPLALSELPVSVKDIVKKCLKYESSNRPSTDEIIELFTKL